MAKLSPRLSNIEESQTLLFDKKAKDMKRQGIDVISLGAGEPDFATPENIKLAAKKAIDSDFTKYTDTAGIPELREAICRKLHKDNNIQYESDEIIVSCGAKHSIYNLCQALLGKGDEVIIPVPYWVSYSEQVKLADATPVFAETDDFQLTAENISRKITKKTKLIMLNSPNNPTGAVIEKKELQKIAELAVKKQIHVMSDEIYEKIIYGKKHYSIASLNESIKALTLTVNGFSKSFSMTGWRLGYAAGPKGIISAMIKLQGQMTSNPTSISQKAGVEALNGPQQSVENMRKQFEERRNYLVARLNKIPGIKCKMPDGAFYAFADISGIEKDSMKFSLSLLEKGKIAVVPGVAFGSDGHIRISYATSMDNITKALDRIESFVKNYKEL